MEDIKNRGFQIMKYNGKYNAFDASRISTYPISERSNKVKLEDLLDPVDVLSMDFDLPEDVDRQIDLLAGMLINAREQLQPVILFTGAHMIKNGLSLLIIDLLKRNLITCFSGNMATSIHDFELALIGQTSEYVPQALERGQFGMAYEFSYINVAMQLGNTRRLGLGESLGKAIMDPEFRKEMMDVVTRPGSPVEFIHPEKSVLATCYDMNIPCTIHVGIGTDVTDQHITLDGEAKGGCSARDFLIYTHEIEKLDTGGVVLNIGSAVTGPEVFLKAASMTGNVDRAPKGIITADFDIRPFNPENITDESSVGYYYRDQKSIVVRVPEAYGGHGYYIEGNQKQTIPAFYRKIVEKL